MAENVSDHIDKIVAQLTENGTKFPRAVFANDLAKMGLTTSNEWIEYAKRVVTDPRNLEGRTLVLLRAKKEMLVSPCILVARGKGGNLSESYVQPHTENTNCKYEKLALIEGKASLIKLDKQGELLEANPIVEKIAIINPGEIHTVVFESSIVVLFEEKMVIPGLDKIFVPGSQPEGSAEVPALLEKWHNYADEARAKLS